LKTLMVRSMLLVRQYGQDANSVKGTMVGLGPGTPGNAAWIAAKRRQDCLRPSGVRKTFSILGNPQAAHKGKSRQNHRSWLPGDGTTGAGVRLGVPAGPARKIEFFRPRRQ
jgi:hypothetical protein